MYCDISGHKGCEGVDLIEGYRSGMDWDLLVQNFLCKQCNLIRSALSYVHLNLVRISGISMSTVGGQVDMVYGRCKHGCICVESSSRST